MRFIVINAAPRMETGNTQMVLNPFLVGLRHQGAEVDLALLARKDIRPCRGCFTCYAKTPGVCVNRDDMPGLIERIRRADVLVLATPVYLDGVTSWAKLFIDRLVVFLDPHFVVDGDRLIHPLRWKFPRKIILVSVCGFPGIHNFDPLILHMERLARNLGSRFAGALLRPAVFSVVMKKKYPERVKQVLDAIRSAGEELARTGTISPATLEAAAADICTTEELLTTANAYWDREISLSEDQPA
jgi:multimeric flavodoxin WrbA